MLLVQNKILWQMPPARQGPAEDHEASGPAPGTLHATEEQPGSTHY